MDYYGRIDYPPGHRVAVEDPRDARGEFAGTQRVEAGVLLLAAAKTKGGVLDTYGEFHREHGR